MHCELLITFINAKLVNALTIHSQNKMYKGCHWGCTFSKGTLLYPKAAYYILVHTVLAPKMYITT